jgi:hypothetical protein
MIKNPVFVLLAVLAISCSSTRQAGPILENDNLTYLDRANCIELKLPRVKGWTAGIPSREELARNIVYGAVHVGKILNLVLSVEALNSDLEDYLILLKRANSFDKRPGYKLGSLDSFMLNGQRALRFVYTADVITLDSSLLYDDDTLAGDSTGDSLADEDSTDTLSPILRTPYVYTNVFMKHREFNYWLEISTLEEGYERRKPFIDEVVQGLRVRE